MEKNLDSGSERDVEIIEGKNSDNEEDEDEVEEEDNDKIGELPLSHRKFSGNLLKSTIGDQSNNESYPEVKLSKYAPIDFQEFFPIIHNINDVSVLIISEFTYLP